jgi:hypothetical protein
MGTPFAVMYSVVWAKFGILFPTALIKKIVAIITRPITAATALAVDCGCWLAFADIGKILFLILLTTSEWLKNGAI